MKPAYRVPTMAEIRALPWNGFNAVSFFSGCGGSSLGYRLAGYRVLYANEFVDAARDCYARNKADYTVLDARDIRDVRAADVLDAIGLAVGELDLMDGSPPCASFSSSGVGSEGWGKVRSYSDRRQRTDDLFHEFVRLLEGIQPRTFIAENVSGLIKGKAKGYFLEILKALNAAGYQVRAKLLDAQWLGVPQTRTRTIFIGVRKDLGITPEFPTPLPYRYTLREVLPGLATAGSRTNFTGRPLYHSGIVRLNLDAPVCTLTCVPSDYKVTDARNDLGSGKTLAEWKTRRPGERSKKYFNLLRTSADEPAPCILSAAGSSGGGSAAVTPPYEPRRFTVDECKVLCGFPADFMLKGSYAERWARLGNAVPPLMMREIASVLRDRVFGQLGRVRAGFREAR